MSHFALIGAAGFVAPRHLRAIKETGNLLVAAVDPHDSAGILDRYFPDTRFFTEIERFDRFVERLRRGPEAGHITHISVCSPNYLHDAHVRLALRVRAHAICEKPLVINPWNLDQLAELEQEHDRRVYTVLQLRLLPALQALRARIQAQRPDRPHEVEVAYVTPRGPWYQTSWKGSAEKSGGVAMNIGVHLFDALLWVFGAVEQATPGRLAGTLALERARVRWLLSVERRDLPDGGTTPSDRAALRRLTVDGEPVDLTRGFEGLHTRLYAETLAGRGFGIADARPSIELVHAIRQAAR